MEYSKYVYIVFSPDGFVDRCFQGVDQAREYVRVYYSGQSSGDMITDRGPYAVWRELWEDGDTLGNIVIEKHVVY